MTNTTPHRATPQQWALVTDYSESDCSAESCILELRARIEALEAGATCPVVRSDEGTSYCGLAEQQAAVAPPEPAPVGSLVERVRMAIIQHGDGVTYDDEARAAIREVAAWMRENDCGGAAVRWLQKEAEL